MAFVIDDVRNGFIANVRNIDIKSFETEFRCEAEVFAAVVAVDDDDDDGGGALA
jgi:hypothetical protein